MRKHERSERWLVMGALLWLALLGVFVLWVSRQLSVWFPA
jgi:hypothetical protein